MRASRLIVIATAVAVAVGTGAAVAEEPRAPAETVTPSFREALPNVPGKSLVSAVVDYAPGAKSKPHHHAASGFVYVYVLSGAVRSQVGDEPVRVYRAGDSFRESPGAHHRVSENASETEPAKLLAVFVVDSDETNLTTYDSQ